MANRSLWWLPLIAGCAGLMALGAVGEVLTSSQIGDELGNGEPRATGGPSVLPQVLAAYSADWRYAAGDTGRDLVDLAIEDATAGMNEVAHEHARERLREHFMPETDDVIELRMLGERLDLHIEGCAPLDGVRLDERVAWRCGAHELEVEHRLDDSALDQHAVGDNIEVHRRFVVKQGVLSVGVIVDDPRLPRSLRFELDYEPDDPSDAVPGT